MSINASANFPLLVSREHAGNTIAKALRLFVGRGRQFSVKQLSNSTGVKDRVIESALCEGIDYRPLTPEALLSIATFLGAAFTSEVIAIADQGAFDLPDADDPPPGEMAADLSDDTATVVRAAVDNEFDPGERRTLRPVGVRLMSHGARLLALDAGARRRAAA